MSNIFHIANLLTGFRVLIVPFFIYAILGPNVLSGAAALVLFGLASVSDYLDGYFARKYNRRSRFGEFFDPLADKLLVGGAFIAFALLPDLLVPLWLVAIILARELFVTLLRVLAIKKGRPVRTEYSGKLKTAVQMGTITIVLVLLLIKRILASSKIGITIEEGPGVWVVLFGTPAGILAYYIPFALVACSALIALVSMLQYIRKNWSVFVRNKSPLVSGE
jgi:CDP-diacylglycerol--glycerol-3-phosphate 3-phosphatidyltransferase